MIGIGLHRHLPLRWQIGVCVSILVVEGAGRQVIVLQWTESTQLVNISLTYYYITSQRISYTYTTDLCYLHTTVFCTQVYVSSLWDCVGFVVFAITTLTIKYMVVCVRRMESRTTYINYILCLMEPGV